jgi:hypothetical protein
MAQRRHTCRCYEAEKGEREAAASYWNMALLCPRPILGQSPVSGPPGAIPGESIIAGTFSGAPGAYVFASSLAVYFFSPTLVLPPGADPGLITSIVIYSCYAVNGEQHCGAFIPAYEISTSVVSGLGPEAEPDR